MPAAPKLDPVRRNSRVGPLKLPAEGRKGRVPKFPMPAMSVLRWEYEDKRRFQVRDDDASEARREQELELWDQLWRTPQAVAWEQMGWVRVVARYARLAAAAEELDKDALSEARQLEDRLGLTPKAMRLLLWEVVTDEVGQQRQASDSGARRRIKAV